MMAKPNTLTYFARTLGAAMLAAFSCLPAVVSSETVSAYETLEIKTHGEALIARKDDRTDAAVTCTPGFVPTILSQKGVWSPDLDVPPGFLFAPRNQILIRRGSEKTLSASDGSSDIDITSVRRSRYGEVVFRSRAEREIYQNATVELTLYGCFSPYSFLITDGTIAIGGRAESYSIAIDHTFSQLGAEYEADISVWYTAYVEAARFGDGSAYSGYYSRGWQANDLPHLGTIAVRSAPIPWEFYPVEGDGPVFNGAVELLFSAYILDSGLFTATE